MCVCINTHTPAKKKKGLPLPMTRGKTTRMIWITTFTDPSQTLAQWELSWSLLLLPVHGARHLSFRSLPRGVPTQSAPPTVPRCGGAP